jgi:uncharacterized repeat protein (TIGR03803 family)
MRVSRCPYLLRVLLALAAASCLLSVSARAQTFKTLATFDGTNGLLPMGILAQGTDANFYGTTYGGGTNSAGEIFAVNANGKLAIPYTFCSAPGCPTGNSPEAGLTLGADGYFYGTASGNVFKLSLDGTMTTFYDGGDASGALTLGSNGSFYGATSYGFGLGGAGVIFEVSSAGVYRVLYTFCSQQDCADGSVPFTPPIQGIDGNLYGTTYYGGSKGFGVVYELKPSGQYRVLHNFCSRVVCLDGGYPKSLVQDSSGNLYGTTISGGDGYGSLGTVYKITPSKQYSVLHNFNIFEAESPSTPILANDGNLYGTTRGPNPIIFEVTPEGVFSVLYHFSNHKTSTGVGQDGLFQGTDGFFYGIDTDGAGPGGDGNVFSFSNNMKPLVETAPTMGKAGTRVIILGNNLTGSSSVTFGGVPAAFTVESDTYISATVPTGATSGVVSVFTPNGTLESNPQFVVTN